jgi:MFS family permease
MMLLGSGIIGGIGLGLGYISPVSTLIKWFPDKRGMATGMAIMGFGGGAMIGSPLAAELMKHFATPPASASGRLSRSWVVCTSWPCSRRLRLPHSRLRLAARGWTPPVQGQTKAMITHGHVHVKKIWGIPQFWLVWMVLTMNVSAGIGVIGMASPMLQEVFGGSLIGCRPSSVNSTRPSSPPSPGWPRASPPC